MLATISGILALLVGLAVLLLPLLVTEMSRPRDALWGAVVLLLGLVLVTSAERLSGAPMLAVLCGGLLIGRLGGEVLQLRWRQLTPEEQQRLSSAERWTTGLNQLAITVGRLLATVTAAGSGLAAALKRPARPTAGSPKTTKRWVRPEADTDAEAPSQPSEAPTAPPEAEGSAPSPPVPAGDALASPEPGGLEPDTPPQDSSGSEPREPDPLEVATIEQESAGKDPVDPETVVVRSFAEIEALVTAAGDTAGAEAEADGADESSGVPRGDGGAGGAGSEAG